MTVELVTFALFAFTAGAVTFFAPCAYPLLPGYVAYFLGDGSAVTSPLLTRLRRALVVSAAVCLGFALVYLALVGILLLLGSRLLQHVILLELVVGSVLIVLGIHMAISATSPFGYHVRLPVRRRSSLSYVFFGVLYAAAAAGCTAPIFLGVAGVSLGGGPALTIVGFGSYAVGMSALMVGITVLVALGRGAVLRRVTDNMDVITRFAGVLLILAGGAQLYLFAFRYNGLEALGLV